MKTESNFLSWHKEKYKINNKSIDNVYFREKDIWFCRIGMNIGYEEDGKGDCFLRPVIIIKKINKNLFIGIPLTSSDKIKDDRFYYKFKYIESKTSYAILPQIRAFDSKRLDYKNGEIKSIEFLEIKQKIKDLIL